MRKLIKVIAVPILCGIVIASSFFVSEFHSEGEDVVAIPRASVVEKTEPVITVLQDSSMWNGRVDRCEVRADICDLVYEELESRSNYDVVFFTAGEYSAYGVPIFQVENHYFSRYE